MSEKSKLKKLYWEDSLSLREIADKLDWSYSKIYYRFREKHDIPTHEIIWSKLEIQDQELRKTLNTKYSSMKARIEGRNGRSRYEGLDLLPEPKFVELCNENQDRIREIWNRYLEFDRELKYALSIDRIDRSLGYTKDNIQFVPSGFNSWKDEINPVKVTCEDDTYYFASATGGAKQLGWRSDDIRQVMRGESNPRNVSVQPISIDELLKYHNLDSLKEYYHQFIL
ncbi:MAG: hypothetical protein K9L56_15470 [Clostridiales bacterium]|nr:hypothetical protein [Clostridiales bacterium]